MIINLKKSVLFTSNPAQRFNNKYNVDLWDKMWYRYKTLSYSPEELGEYFHIKTNKRIHPQAIRRWIWRMEVYNKTLPIMNKGVECVKSSYFGKYEEDVIKELSKNISVHPETKIFP